MDNENDLWLEDIESEQSLNFVREANQKTLSWLTKTKSYQRYYETCLSHLLSKEKPVRGVFFGGYFYNFMRDKNHPFGVLRRTQTHAFGPWELLFDYQKLLPDWTHAGVVFNYAHPNRCLLRLSYGGKDAVSMREFDFEKKEFVSDGFHLPLNKQNAIYRDTDTLWYSGGEKNSSGYPKQVFELKRGQGFAESRLIFDVGASDEHVGLSLYKDLQSGVLLPLIIEFHDFWRNEIHFLVDGERICPKVPGNTQLIGIKNLEAYYQVMDAVEGFFPGTILRVHLARPLEYSVIWNPPKDRIVTSILMDESRFYVNYNEKVHRRFAVLNLNEDPFHLDEFATEEGVSRSVSSFDALTHEIFIEENSFLQPMKTFVFNKSRQLKLIYENESSFDFSNYRVQQLVTQSVDGTEIPYFVIGPKSQVAPLKTILYGYGGFKVGLTPSLLGIDAKTWLADGGVWVVANIRGGDEFGSAWHQSVIKMNRKKSFEDFAAVADDLVKRKICKRESLCLFGGSNGGLLVAATMIARPDLCQAVLCAIPLLDMTRYHLLLSGSSWKSEYGTVEDSEEMKKYILSYSPLQNLVASKKYPSVLFVTSTYDDRVHPAHARRMYAKMKRYGYEVFYYEEREGGHGGNVVPEVSAKRLATQLSFIGESLKL